MIGFLRKYFKANITLRRFDDPVTNCQDWRINDEPMTQIAYTEIDGTGSSEVWNLYVKEDGDYVWHSAGPTKSTSAQDSLWDYLGVKSAKDAVEYTGNLCFITISRRRSSELLQNI